MVMLLRCTMLCSSTRLCLPGAVRTWALLDPLQELISNSEDSHSSGDFGQAGGRGDSTPVTCRRLSPKPPWAACVELLCAHHSPNSSACTGDAPLLCASKPVFDFLAARSGQEYLSVPMGQAEPVCEEKSYTVVEDRPVQKERRILVRACMRSVSNPNSPNWHLSRMV